MAWLGAQPPSTVIVASGSSIPDLDSFILVDAQGDVHAGGAKEQAWASSLARAYAAMEEQGHQVAAVELIPQWVEDDGTAWSPRDCRLVDLVRDRSTCERHRSLAEMDLQQHRTLAAGRQAARTAGVTPIRVRDVLCSDGCGTTHAEVGLYSDSAHLTPDGAAMLMPRFVELMSRPPR